MQKRSEETKSRLLQAALTLFSQSGYSSTGVADICATAGVSKGAFYHHFESKQAVFIELIQNWLKILDENLNASRKDAQDVPAALLEMSELFETVFQQSSEQLPMFLEIWLQASRDPAVWGTLIAPYRRYQVYFKQLLEQGMQENSIHRLDSDLASRALLSMAVGLLLQSILDPGISDWSEVSREGIRIFVAGLEQEQG